MATKYAIFLLPFLRRGQPFVSTKVQPVFDWTQTPHMFWTIRQVLTAEHDQLASKHFPKIIISISTLNFPVLCKF